jgi:hypothetical protein
VFAPLALRYGVAERGKGPVGVVTVLKPDGETVHLDTTMRCDDRLHPAPAAAGSTT